ncbi:MAG: sulfatase-like hydrolase/transferase [Pirellulales bacterium]|nr:sulfatase-like hydrolase/transferase [Pirellulales bacterium]
MPCVRVVKAHVNDAPRLFNLADDLGEKDDRAAREPERVVKLQSLWDAWNGENESPRWIDLRWNGTDRGTRRRRSQSDRELKRSTGWENHKRKERSQTMKRTLFLAGVAAGLLGQFFHPACAAENHANIVLILIDDFGYECVAANGGESYRTPVMDRLAATGVRFEHCHVQPLCTPTRVQLMTGQSNRRNYTHFGHLDPSQTTFGNLLKQAGYATCVAGKWQLHNGFEGPGHFGFDEYCLWQLTRRPGRYKNPGLEINGKTRDYTRNEYGPDIVSDYALDFITRKKDVPFFLYYPMMLTHAPYDATPDSPDYQTAQSLQGRAGGHFPDMVAYTDKLIGKLVAKLEELHLRDKTLLLVLGDNGTGRGTPSRFQGRDVVGGKGLTTTWGTHVPAIANWPGRVVAGKVSPDLIDATDFLPTICEVAGAPLPTGVKIDGRSFLPQLKGEKGRPREWLYAWYNPDGGVTAKAEFAHSAEFKLYADGRFYNVAKDDKELTPLADASLGAREKQAKVSLQDALRQFAGPRDEYFVKQGRPFGGEAGDGAKKAERRDAKKKAER